MSLTEESIHAVVLEMTQAPLGDGRLTQRLGHLLNQLAQAPDQSLPQVLGDPSALEAAYRFLSNPSVQAEHLLEPHFEGTRSRAVVQGAVVVAHDTTEFCFGGESRKKEVGRMHKKGTGFYGHVALCMSQAQGHEPLGVIGLSLNHRGPKKKAKQTHAQRRDDPSNESRRWEALCRRVQRRMGEGVPCVHVMDREADTYPLLAGLVEQGSSFVVRVCHERRVKTEAELPSALLHELAGKAPILVEREVLLSRRKKSSLPKRSKIHPARESRIAKLSFKGVSVLLARPQGYKQGQGPEMMRLQVVFVEEPHPPTDAEKVCWWLWTSEPVETAEQALRVVDLYRARWKVEEYFQALKTGCAYESKQLKSRHSLVNLLCLLIPIAWKLLQLKSLCQQHPDSPAKAVLDSDSIQILSQIVPGVSETSTVKQALAAIARLGGHRPQNGPPGWRVLMRGYQKLLILRQGFLLQTVHPPFRDV